MVSIWKDTIKVGDIYIHQGGTMVVVEEVRTYPQSSNAHTACSTYLQLAFHGNNSWYGMWEQSYFLQHFRPVTKLEKLLAGV